MAPKQQKLKKVSRKRRERKVVERMIAKLPENCVQIGVTHVLAEEYAQQIAARLREKFPQAYVRVDQANPSIGSHLGPGAVGIAAFWE